MGAYLRRIQGAHGGWPLFHDGDMDVSASVTAYLALKAIGDKPDAEHMRRAREAILARGGAAASNVFTRFLLALFGVVTWRCVPVMPVEIILLPQWFPFHLSKISYWSRTTIVPMLVLQALKARARNPKGVSVDELFIDPPLTLGPPHKARAPEDVLVHAVSRHRHSVARHRAAVSQTLAPTRHRQSRRLPHLAPQRRGRDRLDLPADGLCGDDVRRAWL